MPEATTVTEVAPPPPPVTETVTATPTPEVPPTAVMDPALADSMRSMIDGVNVLNQQLEGTSDTGGVLLLDADQFTAFGFALVLIVCLLAALLIVGMRR